MHDLPDYPDVNFEVAVNDPVAQTDDLAPGYLGIGLPGAIADTGRGLTDDLQNLEYRVLMQVAPFELRICLPGRELRGHTRSDKHIEQQGTILPHR